MVGSLKACHGMGAQANNNIVTLREQIRVIQRLGVTTPDSLIDVYAAAVQTVQQTQCKPSSDKLSGRGMLKSRTELAGKLVSFKAHKNTVTSLVLVIAPIKDIFLPLLNAMGIAFSALGV